MSTIVNYEQDRSAMGRINAWRMAWNLAQDRPFGGGFEITSPMFFPLCARRERHSCRTQHLFQVLGEHGFVGLALFLLLWILVWRSAGWLRRHGASSLNRNGLRISARCAKRVSLRMQWEERSSALRISTFRTIILCSWWWRDVDRRKGLGAGRHGREGCGAGAFSVGVIRLISALAALIRYLSPSGTRARLSILIFHRVLPEPDPLAPELPDRVRFEQILQWLKSWLNVLPLDQAVRRLSTGTLPERAASITFDDGYADNCTVALPLLLKHGLPATFFIATGFLDGGGCSTTPSSKRYAVAGGNPSISMRSVSGDAALPPSRNAGWPSTS